jgi:hypothetical protein
LAVLATEELTSGPMIAPDLNSTMLFNSGPDRNYVKRVTKLVESAARRVGTA